ncbi:hypothetical protein RUM44_011886 [Polyplax serrata]|uniref:KIF-binding protein n=1 Tax=Polyplax serrata TaxID=468196 RepID=A0ABR1B9S3_POLSC
MDIKTFETLHEQYELLKATIKSDKMGSETEPGWDHSPAKRVLNKMLETIRKCLNNTDKNSKQHFRLLAMQGALYYQHAKVLVHFNQTELAQDVLKTCIDFLKDSILVSEITFLGLRVLNHYCYLLTKCGELGKAQEFLELAERKYLELKESGDIGSLPLYSNDDLFKGTPELTPNKEINEKLEKLVTNNLQMLGFVHNKQGDLDKFAVYHHQVLKRQLDMREGDATVWAMKTARLGYFFLTRNKFAQARHHLAAACYVLSQYENTLKTLETTDLVLSKWDELNHRYADIAKCWVRYGLFLFNASKMKLVSAFYGDTSTYLDNTWTNPFDNFIYGCNGSEENDNGVWQGSERKSRGEGLQNTLGSATVKDVENCTGKTENPDKKDSTRVRSTVLDVLFENTYLPNMSQCGDDTNDRNSDQTSQRANSEETKAESEEKKFPETDELNFRFPNLDLNCFENCVSSNYVDSVQSARTLFLFTHSWLKKSKLFYPLKDHPMEYVNVILDLSELYRYLAFYEDDIENQYSVQKRRADTLETLSTVLKEVRPQCYLAISIELFRELAEIHLELMGLNLRRLYLSHPEPSKTEDAKGTSGQAYANISDYLFHKMDAVADVHRRLYRFGEVMGHGALGDFETGYSRSGFDGDMPDPGAHDLFDSYQATANAKLFS